VNYQRGYYVQYGGQFDLQSASAINDRGSIPTFILILFCISFWFYKEALMVYSAAIIRGGRSLFLWLRGLPSIGRS
jgi:Cu/Ag efflux pump CusA